MTKFIKYNISIILLSSLFLTKVCEAKESFDDMLKKAHTGDSQAQYTLGLMYDKGNDSQPRDSIKALYWYNKAADNGSLDAKSLLGKLHEFGYISVPIRNDSMLTISSLYHRNVVKDMNKAVSYYKECAKSDRYYWEQAHLADLLYEGKKIDKNYSQAIVYLRRIINNPMISNFEKGKFLNRLSICYRYGRGVEIDIDISNYWRSKAAESGYVEAMEVSGEGIYGTVYFEDGTPFQPLDNSSLQIATVRRKCDEGKTAITVHLLFFKKEDKGFFTLPDKYKDETLVMEFNDSFLPIEFIGTQNIKLTLIKKVK